MEIDEKSKSKSLYGSLFSSLLFAIVGVLLFHYKYEQRLGLGLMPRYSGGVYPVLLAAIFIIFFVIGLFLFLPRPKKTKLKQQLTEEEKARKKEIRAERFFLTIDFFMTVLFILLNQGQLKSIGLMWAIAEVAAIFAVILAVFQVFHKFQYIPKRLLEFGYKFLTRVFVPTLFLIIIMLGAYQATYHYPDTLRGGIADSADNFAQVMKQVYYNTIITLYNIGQSSPYIFTWLPIIAFVIMVVWLIASMFTKQEIRDEDLSAQELLDKAVKEEIEEKAAEEQAIKNPSLLRKLVISIKRLIKGGKKKNGSKNH